MFELPLLGSGRSVTPSSGGGAGGWDDAVKRLRTHAEPPPEIGREGG